MARSPQRTCPNLSRLFDEGEPGLLAAFLQLQTFERLNWLADYRFAPDDPEGPGRSAEMLLREPKTRLDPLEMEASRIVKIATERGQYALEGLARSKLLPDRQRQYLDQRDDLARSQWAYLNEHPLFEAAESTLHLKLYRRYDRHYQTFLAKPASGGVSDDAIEQLLTDLRARLDRGEGYDVERFDIPEEGDEPASEMYLIYHPNPPTSARQIDDDGVRTQFYFRPPGVAMVVYTPSTGRVHVRAGTRALRHEVAERFIETALEQPLSRQPVDFQAYDITRFISGFDLPTPGFDDVAITRAKVIRADISTGSLSDRLSIATTIDQGVEAVMARHEGLRSAFRSAIAVRFIEFAVRYRRADADDARTLNFTISDRNTSSLMSLDDPFERVLGHRLLREWGVLDEGRAPTKAESVQMMPTLLALWDSGLEKVAGSWFVDRDIDPKPLVETGFLVPAGYEDDVLIDEDDDGLGLVDAEIDRRPGDVLVGASPGQEAPDPSPERYILYRVRDEWVAEHLRARIEEIVDAPGLDAISPNLIALGSLRIDTRDVPVYLARRLGDERMRASVDTELRARSDRGVGLVLQAGDAAGHCIAANVLTPIVAHIDPRASEIAPAAERLRGAYRFNRMLARGGQVVELIDQGGDIGLLVVPERGTIDIVGANRVLVIGRLVDAHNAGTGSVKASKLIAGFEGQSLPNIFGQPLWDKLKDGFLRSPRRGFWEIAA